MKNVPMILWQKNGNLSLGEVWSGMKGPYSEQFIYQHQMTFFLRDNEN